MGLCCYKPVEPFRRTTRERHVWRGVLTALLQFAILAACVAGALALRCVK